MSHPLTACMSEIEMLQGRIRELEAMLRASRQHITAMEGDREALEAALRRIEDHTDDRIAADIARAAPEQDK